MFPAQTSLIPVQVALARFLEESGFLAASGNYPYWYLGTTPFRYLTGPILPSVLALIHRLVPNFSLFEIMLGLIAVCWTLGGVGVYLLVKELAPLRPSGSVRGSGELVALLSAIFYFFGPIVPFLFRFSDGLYLIAFSFLPYILLLYLKLLKNWSRKLAIFTVLMISFVLLIDTLIIPTLILGMAAVFLAQVGWKRMEEKLKKSLVLGAWCLVLVTLWYTPGYWWTLLGAPSFGGKGLGIVIVWLGKLLPTVLAFGIAIVSVKFFKKRNLLRDFCFYWLFIFGFLTLIRFLSDPDFWLDWTSYGIEFQLGLALIFGGLLKKRLEDRRQKTEDGLQKTDDRMRIIENQPSVIGLQNLFSVFSFPSSMFLALYLILFTFVFNKYVLGTLQRDITQTVEYRIGKQLSEIAKPQEKVFLSGTTAFWLNAFFDIPQVRGGRDQASVHPTWRQAVWEIRDGATAENAEKWLKTLNISYLVVHTQDSEEFYHDFAQPEKFEKVNSLKLIFSDRGDLIYQLEK